MDTHPSDSAATPPGDFPGFSRRLAAPRSMEILSPLGKGGIQGGLGVGCPSGLRKPRHDNPLKAQRPLSFRLHSPFSKGDLGGSP